MMGHAATLGLGHFVGTDIEPSIHGGRIATDDFSAPLQGKRDTERALAGRGRSKDGENRGAQTLHPEERERGDESEQNQQPELLRARRKGHGLT
jgi:hypothetical protein